MSAKQKPSDPPSPIDVLVVDHWLIFDCPSCQSTIKIDERDAKYEVQCPTCAHEFAPVFDKGLADGSVTAAKRTYSESAPQPAKRTRKRRRHSPVADHHNRRTRSPKEGESETPLAVVPGDEIPSEGRAVLPPPRQSSPPRQSAHDEDDDSNLPVRSALELERRRVAATVDQRLHPAQSGDDQLDAMIDEESGGKYKRIRVRTRKKRQTEKQRKRRFLLWVGAGALCMIGVSIYIASLVFAEGLKEEVAENAEDGSEDGLVSTAPTGAKIGNWRVLMTQFMNAEAPEQLLPLIRRPKRVEAALLAYYSEGLPKFTGRTILHPVDRSLPEGFRSGQMILSNQVLPFFLEKTASHGYRLDWESFAGIGSMPWTEFIESHTGDTVRMRVIVSRANFYAGVYDDSRNFMSVRLEDITRKHAVYGYIPKAGPRLRGLRDLVLSHFPDAGLTNAIGRDRSSEEVRVILDIRYPADSESTAQVEIVEMARNSWLLP